MLQLTKSRYAIKFSAISQIVRKASFSRATTKTVTGQLGRFGHANSSRNAIELASGIDSYDWYHADDYD